MKKAYLVLECGKVFVGESFGGEGESIGELVFTTEMCSYMEALTDPASYGQIVLQTFPGIGNYGVINEDIKKAPVLNGYIVREKCDAPSNFRCDTTLEKYLAENNIPALCGIDTRAVTKLIREMGAMNAAIMFDEPGTEDFEKIKAYKVSDAVKNVSTDKSEYYGARDGKYNVAVIDFGCAYSVVDALISRSCNVTVLPYNTKSSDITGNYDGVILSDGPGDPLENTDVICEIRELLGKVPVLGTGLGHSVLALAFGGKTEKMKYGNRGSNIPVICKKSGRTYITKQNHAYSVVSAEMGEETFVNANDKSIEGISYPAHKAFSVQFTPVTGGSANDTEFLYDDFVKLMGGETNAI